MTFEQKKRLIRHVAVYLRLSRDKREKEQTLENHLKLTEEFMQKHGYIFKVYSEVVSGAKESIEDRPQLKLVMEEIENYDALFVISLDRISRIEEVALLVKRRLQQTDKPVLTLDAVYDLNTEADSFTYNLLTYLAAQEYARIQIRARLNKISLAKQGKVPFAPAPFGYRRNNKDQSYVIEETEARTIEYAFKLALEGLGNVLIAERLNAEGYKTQRGNLFTPSTVGRLLYNEAYAGTLVYKDKDKHGNLIQEIKVEGAFPAIVSPSDFKRVRAGKLARSGKSRKSTYVSPLKDLVYCSCCKRRMSVAYRTDRSNLLRPCRYYLADGSKCNNSGVEESKVINEVLNTIYRYKEDSKRILQELSVEDTSSVEAEYEERVEHLKGVLVELEQRQERLLDALEFGALTPQKYQERKEGIEAEEKEYRVQLEETEKALRALDIREETERLQSHLEGIEGLEQYSRHLSTEQLNQLLKTFIARIEYKRVLPADIASLHNNSLERRSYPFTVEIEYL